MIDDHVWITVGGAAWAIRRVRRNRQGEAEILMLWRGYVPDLEYYALDVTHIDWEVYADHAAELLARS